MIKLYRKKEVTITKWGGDELGEGHVTGMGMMGSTLVGATDKVLFLCRD